MSGTRTTIVRVVAVAALVVVARALTGGGSDRSAPDPVLESRDAVMVVRPGESPAAASRRILSAYASFTVVPPADAEAGVRELATATAADGLVAELRSDLGRLSAGYPGGATRLWVAPLASRDVAMGPGEHRVDVWFARVVAPPGRPVYAEWRLGQLDLQWERDGWRLERFEETAGPRPASLPGPADPADGIVAALDGFEGERP